MTEEQAAAAAQTFAHETLLAWLIAHTPSISLNDTRTLPAALMSVAPGAVPEPLEDVFRVHARDACQRVMKLAASIRGNT